MSDTEKTIRFRAVAEKIDAVELHAHQDALVRQGLDQKRKGRVVRHDEVVKRLKKTGRARP